jgi:hypothetical protein
LMALAGLFGVARSTVDGAVERVATARWQCHHGCWGVASADGDALGLTRKQQVSRRS